MEPPRRGPQAVAEGLPDQMGQIQGGDAPGYLRASFLSRTLRNLGMPSCRLVDVVWCIDHPVRVMRGGQAKVFISRWDSSAVEAAPSGSEFLDGQMLAFKQVFQSNGGGKFPEIQTKENFEQAGLDGQRALRVELRLLDILHKEGCGSRVVKPLSMVQWPGRWEPPTSENRRTTWWEPTYGYFMPAYERGSVDTLLKDICYGALPGGAAQRYLSMTTLSFEYLALLAELHRIHTTPGVQLQMQDLTANNLLVDDGAPGGGVCLLFTDPAMALPISMLQEAKPSSGYITGTWLWGSMRARKGLFDPKADVYSISFIFAEMWLAAEGLPMPVTELILTTGLGRNKARGVQFMRMLIAETMRSHHNNGSLRPRVQRHLPVSWLGAWTLLLGFRDYEDEQQMRQEMHCLRPEEEEMLELAALWARIAAAAEELPEALALEEAQSADCQPLISDMCQLHTRLLELSHLEAPRGAEIKWFAANFMALRHPLVLVMKEQGAAGVGVPEKFGKRKGWEEAILFAQGACGHTAEAEQYVRALHRHEEELGRGQQAQKALGKLWQWYQGQAGQLQPHQRMPAELDAQLRQLAAGSGQQAMPPQAERPAAAGPPHVSNTVAAGQAGTQLAEAAAAGSSCAVQEPDGSRGAGTAVAHGWMAVLQAAEQAAQKAAQQVTMTGSSKAVGQGNNGADSSQVKPGTAPAAAILDPQLLVDQCRALGVGPELSEVLAWAAVEPADADPPMAKLYRSKAAAAPAMSCFVSSSHGTGSHQPPAAHSMAFAAAQANTAAVRSIAGAGSEQNGQRERSAEPCGPAPPPAADSAAQQAAQLAVQQAAEQAAQQAVQQAAQQLQLNGWSAAQNKQESQGVMSSQEQPEGASGAGPLALQALGVGPELSEIPAWAAVGPADAAVPMTTLRSSAAAAAAMSECFTLPPPDIDFHEVPELPAVHRKPATAAQAKEAAGQCAPPACSMQTGPHERSAAPRGPAALTAADAYTPAASARAASRLSAQATSLRRSSRILSRTVVRTAAGAASASAAQRGGGADAAGPQAANAAEVSLQIDECTSPGASTLQLRLPASAAGGPALPGMEPAQWAASAAALASSPAVPAHGGGASMADAASTDGSSIYPRAGEKCAQWLARIAPQLEVATLEAVLPGEQQAEVFKSLITSLELADEVLDAWADSSTFQGMFVAGMPVSVKLKGRWYDAVSERCGLHRGRLPAGREGNYSQQFLKGMKESIVPAVQSQVRAMLGQAKPV